MKFPLKLQKYLEKEKIKDSPFARAIGRSPSMISRYKKGLSKPSYHTALKIRNVTDNYFTMEEMGYAD